MLALYHAIVLSLVFIFGAILGSFLNVVIYRLPLRKSLFSGNTYCPHCKHTLRTTDLIPIVNYLLLGGTCRYCKEAISPRYLLVEVLTGLLALLSFLAFFPPVGFLLNIDFDTFFHETAQAAGLAASWIPVEIPLVAGAAVSSLLVFALLCILVLVTFVDADTMEIPNSLVICVAALGFVSIAVGPTASLSWYDHLIGALCVSIPLFLLAFTLLGSFGLGDVKLMAAAGLLLGWQLVLVATFIGIALGGIYGIYLLLTRKKSRKEHFAFGPALSAGIATSIFLGPQIITWYFGFF